MNCQAARQALMIDPQRVPADVNAHIAECDECARYQAQVEKLDALTIRSIKQPMRENLSQGVIAAQRLRSGRNRIMYSIAASVVAVALAVMWLLPQHATDPSWGTLMAEHMDEDPLHEYVVDPQAVERLQAVMAEVGVTKRGELPRVLRARVCPIGKEVSVHAVFEVNGERVVAFLVNRAMSSEELRHHQWRGELVQVDGGTVAVFSQNAAAMQAVKVNLMNSVAWHAV